MNNIEPYFRTHASLGKSILTTDNNLNILDDEPVSVIAIAKKYNLEYLTVIDTSFTLFPDLYKNCEEHKINLIFGIRFNICNSVLDKTEQSLDSNCKVSVIMKNSNGYQDLIKLNDKINGEKDNFYYSCRGDWNILNENITNNLEVIIDPYDNFIHKNLLENGGCIPSFNKINPIFTYANMELPFDGILSKEIINFANSNSYEVREVHPIYYFSKSDFEAYSVFRAINNRSTFKSPDLNFFCQSTFCFESYLNKIGKNL